MNNWGSRREFLEYSLAPVILIAAAEGILNNVMAQTARGVTRWTS